jgi:hypothetical protein
MWEGRLSVETVRQPANATCTCYVARKRGLPFSFPRGECLGSIFQGGTKCRHSTISFSGKFLHEVPQGARRVLARVVKWLALGFGRSNRLDKPSIPVYIWLESISRVESSASRRIVRQILRARGVPLHDALPFRHRPPALFSEPERAQHEQFSTSKSSSPSHGAQHCEVVRRQKGIRLH